jgi:acetyl esterase/lipase
MLSGGGLAAALAALAGCTTAGALSTLSAAPGVTVVRDVAYGRDPRQRLDVYAPPGAAPGRPVVVFFYGGSWDSGAKADYAFVGQALARQGYLAVVADYRLFPRVAWPAFLMDCAFAVKWAHDHAAEYGGDAARLVVMGHSAGAYNAVELAVDDRWMAVAALDRRNLAAVVGLSGPYDFLPLRTLELQRIFGPEADRADTQPINHVDGAAAPMLLITGDRDIIVNPGNTDRMAAKVRAAGGQAQVIHYPKLGHPLTVGVLAPPLQWIAPVMRDVSRFIDAATAPRGG